ncbi:MAG TPA: hypothetical protein VL126_14970 [Bacteroidota bacterium]|nr:hypothetical protein [Bacteroidota bacterium]
MNRIRLTGAVILTIILFVPSRGHSQDAQELTSNSFGLRIGYTFSEGDWSKSRVAPNIVQFRGGLTLGADLEFALSKGLAIVLDGGYEQLDGSDWANYVRSKGEYLSVNAWFAHGGLLLKPYLIATPQDMLGLELGGVALFGNGSETYQGVVYQYDFLKSFHVGFEAGIEYDRRISEKVAVTIRGGGIFVPGGVGYADGEDRTVISLPVTLGIRIIL